MKTSGGPEDGGPVLGNTDEEAGEVVHLELADQAVEARVDLLAGAGEVEVVLALPGVHQFLPARFSSHSVSWVGPAFTGIFSPVFMRGTAGLFRGFRTAMGDGPGRIATAGPAGQPRSPAQPGPQHDGMLRSSPGAGIVVVRRLAAGRVETQGK